MSGTLMKTLHETTRVSRHDVHGRAGLSPGCVTEVGGSGSTPVTRTPWGTAQRLRRAATRPKTSRGQGGSRPPLRHRPRRHRNPATRRSVARSGGIAAGSVAGPAADCRSRLPRPRPVLRRGRRRGTAGRPGRRSVALVSQPERGHRTNRRCTRVLVPEAPEPEPSTWLWESPPERVCDVGSS